MVWLPLEMDLPVLHVSTNETIIIGMAIILRILCVLAISIDSIRLFEQS